jgi:hypothetical protein
VQPLAFGQRPVRGTRARVRAAPGAAVSWRLAEELGRRRQGGGGAEGRGRRRTTNPNDEAAKRHLVPNPNPNRQPRSSEGSAAPAAAAAAPAGGDGRPKGTGRRMCSSTAFTTHCLIKTTWVGRRGGEVRCTRRVPQRSPGKAGRGRADGDFDADHGLGLDGVGRSAIRAGAGPAGPACLWPPSASTPAGLRQVERGLL